MYAHCLFCNADLGRNEALEAFPVGRRLAYDVEKGRLWVVCRACSRWNLTPLEERWEAIEQAERLFRGARLRASTDNVGLAHVADGTELVRVGRALLPEFAGWRYATEFAARRRRYYARVAPAMTISGIGAVLSLGSFVAYMLAPQFLGATSVIGMVVGGLAIKEVGDRIAAAVGKAGDALHNRMLGTPASVAAHVPIDVAGHERRLLVVRRGHLAESTFVPGSDGTLAFVVRHDDGVATLTDHNARHAASLLSPTLNPEGAQRDVVDDAVRAIGVRGGPEAYLGTASRWIGRTTQPLTGAPKSWSADSRVPDAGLLALSPAQRLALEMVFHEDAERRAMDGELAALEQAWRDAEAIAEIADSLALPTRVERAWERLRER